MYVIYIVVWPEVSFHLFPFSILQFTYVVLRHVCDPSKLSEEKNKLLLFVFLQDNKKEIQRKFHLVKPRWPGMPATCIQAVQSNALTNQDGECARSGTMMLVYLFLDPLRSCVTDTKENHDMIMEFKCTLWKRAVDENKGLRVRHFVL